MDPKRVQNLKPIDKEIPNVTNYPDLNKVRQRPEQNGAGKGAKSKEEDSETRQNSTKNQSGGEREDGGQAGAGEEVVEQEVNITFGNCHGGIICNNTPIRPEITSIATANKADFIIMTEAGVPHGHYPIMTGYKAVGVATACGGRISHAGVAIYQSENFQESHKYVQVCENIPGFQAVEAGYESFTIIAFYRSPNNIDKQTQENIARVRDYFHQRPDANYIICGDLNIPETKWDAKEGAVVPHTTVLHEAKQELVDEMLMEYRHQFVDFPTRIDQETKKGTILDVVIAEENMDIRCKPLATKPTKADHEWLSIVVTPPKKLQDIIAENYTPRKEINYKNACEQIVNEVEWADYNSATLEEKVEALHKVMHHYIEIHSEQTSRKRRKRNEQKYKQTRHIRSINRLKTRRKNGPDMFERQEIRHHEKELLKLNTEEMIRHDNIMNSYISDNPNNLHNILRKSQPKNKIRSLKNSKTGELVEEPEEVAETFATYLDAQQGKKIKENIDWHKPETDGKFLSEIISTPELFDKAIKTVGNSCCKDPYGISAADLVGLYPAIKNQLVQLAEQMFKEGRVPKNIKKVLIIPLPKPPKKPDRAENLRPINLTSNILKLVERVAIIQIRNFLDPQGQGTYEEETRSTYFSDNQDGFRENRGTLNSLLKLSQIIQRVIQNEHGGVVIALDFKKAFDSVPHDKLLEALHLARVRGQVGQWVASWLEDCNFEVQIEEARSKPKNITSGVKQGSCLGPLAFIVFLNTLLNELNGITNSKKTTTTYGDLSERVHIQCYADDISLIYQLPKGGLIKDKKRIAEEIINKYLETCSTWSKKWGITFNHIKCDHIILGGKYKDMDLELYLYGDKKIERTDTIKILGLKIDDQKPDPLKKMEKEARRHMLRTHSQIRAMFKKPTFPMMKNAYHTLVLSRALYASECYNLETIPVDKDGNIKELIKTDKGKITRYEQSEVARTGKRVYRLMFGTKPILDDIARLRRLGKLTSRADELPLTPGQFCIYKDIKAFFRILDDKPGMRTEDFLEKPPNNGRITRSAFESLLDYNNKQTSSNHERRSLTRRHYSLIKWMVEQRIDPQDFVHASKDRRKRIIKGIIDSMDTSDNHLRGEIWNGTYVQPNRYPYNRPQNRRNGNRNKQ